MQLSLSLLGHFSAAVDEQAIAESRTKKIEALLAYLVVEWAHPHRRETLMGIFFPEMADDVASTNLRQTLTRLRRAIQDEEASPPFLTITRESIQFNRQSSHWCDLFAFADLLSGCAEHGNQRVDSCLYCMIRAHEALELYRGPFLADLFLADSAAFEDWATTHRERLQQQALAALRALTTFHTRRGEYTQAIGYGRRQVEIEPWHEEAHQALMRLGARLGQRTEALAQYKRCVDALHNELDVEPSAATTALRNQIARLSPTRPHQLPSQEDAFIGRDEEFAHIYAHLADPTSRLLTLVGAGGIGKTRLALEVGWRITHEFLGPFMHGVYFVSLAEMGRMIDGEQALMIAIADSLGIALVGVRSPFDVVVGHLRDKELLLIVDNCEEAVNAITCLSKLLGQAPALQILATSRQPLDLANEFLIRLEGLPFPPARLIHDKRRGRVGSTDTAQANDTQLEGYQAIQLFAHHARRVEAGFSIKQIGQREQQAIARICQACEGMPLALEMAAVWVQTLSCGEIATEIESNFDILRSSSQQHSPRHHSIRAVFDYSWQRLSSAERKLFAQLAVLHGSFDQRAAQTVAGATLPLLVSLVRKSLLRSLKNHPPQPEADAEAYPAPARYALHPLLRQYAAEKLAADAEGQAQAQTSHAHYYCAWLHQQTPALKGGAQQQAIATITLDLDNVRDAWQWAVANQHIAAIDQAVDGFTDFCELRGLFSEGEKFLGQAVSQLQTAQHTTEDDAIAIVVAKTLARQGWLNFLLGRSAVAQKQLEEGVGILHVLEVEAELATPLNYLAYVAYCTDQYPLGLQLSAQAAEKAQQSGNKLGLANARRTAAAIAEVKGELSQSIQQYEQALAVYREIDNRQGACWSLLSLSSCATKLGDYETAIAHAKATVKLGQQIGFRLVEGWALYGLGCIYIRQSNYATATENFEQALQVGRAINDRRQQASVLHWLGTCLRCQGNLTSANAYYEQALPIYREIGNILGEGLALNDLGILARYNKDYTTSLELAQRALKIGQEVGNRDLQRRVFTNLGHLYSDGERFIQAADAYQQALEKTEETQPQARLHPLLGLLHIALSHKNLAGVLPAVDGIDPILEMQDIDGSDEPIRLLETASFILQKLSTQGHRTLPIDTHKKVRKLVDNLQLRSARQIVAGDLDPVPHGFPDGLL